MFKKVLPGIWVIHSSFRKHRQNAENSGYQSPFHFWEDADNGIWGGNAHPTFENTECILGSHTHRPEKTSCL